MRSSETVFVRNVRNFFAHLLRLLPRL